MWKPSPPPARPDFLVVKHCRTFPDRIVFGPALVLGMIMTARITPHSTGISPRLADRFWRATLARDPRADGLFFLAVRSTGIYCRPSCPARRPLRRNVVFYRTHRDAEREGFRPCRRCRPNQISGSSRLVQQAAQILRDSQEDTLRLSTLAGQLVSPPERFAARFSASPASSLANLRTPCASPNSRSSFAPDGASSMRSMKPDTAQPAASMSAAMPI